MPPPDAAPQEGEGPLQEMTQSAFDDVDDEQLEMRMLRCQKR
eukprot:gene7946-4214_t